MNDDQKHRYILRRDSDLYRKTRRQFGSDRDGMNEWVRFYYAHLRILVEESRKLRKEA